MIRWAAQAVRAFVYPHTRTWVCWSSDGKTGSGWYTIEELERLFPEGERPREAHQAPQRAWSARNLTTLQKLLR